MVGDATTVYLVDDDAGVLKAVSRLLRAEGLNVRAFASPSDFLGGFDPKLPGCLVLDISMPGLNGLELQEHLEKLGSLLPIVFLTGHGNIPASVKAMKHGAVDFLTKPVDRADLLGAVQTSLEQNRAARQSHAQRSEIEKRLATLTPRERQVLDHVISGQLNKQIAAELGTVEKTIKVHRANVMDKMKVNSLAELVRLAERAGLEPAVGAAV